MKKMILLALVSSSLLFADDPGTVVFPLLRVGFGARAAALGESFVGAMNDGASLWWNPGSMGFMDHSEVFATYHIWFEDFKDQYAGVAWTTRKGIFGLGFTNSGVGNIEYWNSNNDQIGTGFTSQNAWILALAYSKKIQRNLSMGTAYKLLRERIAETSQIGFVFDFGLNYLARKDVNFGLVLRNLGSMKYGDEGYQLPAELRIGGVFCPYYPDYIFVDLSLVSRTGLLLHLGNEIWVKDMLALRIGYKATHQENKLTFGIGTKYRGFHFDYAFAGYGILGATHRIWLSKEWGRLIPLGSILLKILDAETKKPILASIEFGKPILKKVVTDSITGTCKKKDVPIGEVSVKVAKNKYYPKEDVVKIEPDVIALKVIELKRIPLGTIEGKVVDVKTKKPVLAKITYKGIFEGETYADTLKGGIYSIPRLESGKYLVKVIPQLPGYFSQEETLMVNPGALLVKEFELIKKGEVIVLRGVNFETGKATLLPVSFEILDQAGKILKDNPKLKVEIAGHTDNIPIKTPEFPSNLTLSQSRANAVREYLIKKFGIEPEQLIARGYGETLPIASNRKAEGRAQNRRVEFKVLE